MKITNKSLSIVTGGTGGLGKSISESILSYGGKLLFIARNMDKINLFENDLDEKYSTSFFKLQADLSKKTDLGNIKNYLVKILDSNKEVDEIFLFNNASTIDPIALIDDVGFEDISNALILNIASAYSLSSIVLNINKSYNFSRINIINISSGVSMNPVEGWSAYCISKAGLNMLSRCIAMENEHKETAIFALSVNPGPINTDMQKKIRTADSETIPATKKFETMFNEGKLQDPNAVAQKLFRILETNSFSNGDFVNFNTIN